MKKTGFGGRVAIFLLSAILVLSSLPTLAAQQKAEAVVIKKFQETIDRLGQSLEAKTGCDPYGFRASIRVVLVEGGNEVPFAEFPVVELEAIAAQLVTSQTFDRFNIDANPSVFSDNGFFIYSAGLTGRTLAPDPREFKQVATQYSETVSVNGVAKRLVIHAQAFAIVGKPDDGAILSTLKYHTKNGGITTWDHRTWKTIDPRVAYVRVGPGNENTNSRKGEDHFEQTSVSAITLSSQFNPGHYLPKIQFRGCQQDFTDPERFEDLEAIVKTEEQVSWADFKELKDGTVVPLTSLKASRVKAPDFPSYFSTGNIVRGYIRDETRNPIQGKAIVVLEPMFFPGPEKKEVESLPGGIYEFEEVESGIYKVYVEGRENNFSRVEVCNCPKNNEGPNHTYEADIRFAVSYDVYVTCRGAKGHSYEVVWRNVRIAFMDNEDDIPVYESDYFETGETGFDDDDIEGLSGESDDGPLIIEIDPDPEFVSQRIMPPYKINIPGYGIETYYSDVESNTPEAIRINMDDFYIRPGIDAVNHFYIHRTWDFPQLHVDFSIDLTNEVGAQILTGAQAAESGFQLQFKWERLDDDILEKLKHGEPATKNLSNFYGDRMTVRFIPNR